MPTIQFQVEFIALNCKLFLDISVLVIQNTTMNEHITKRKFLQQKQAYHNAIISIPFFISSLPTKILALSAIEDEEPKTKIDKIYYNGNKFLKTKIVSFNSLQQSRAYYERFKKQKVLDGKGTCWVEYCKDLSLMENILYQYGKIYVPFFESKQLRQLLNDISQVVVLHGLFMEEHLKRSGNPLFLFLDHNLLSLEYIYYRWRTFAYLQSDGDKKYRAEPFRILQGGNVWFPPLQNTLQRGVLNLKQRKYFSELIFKLTRKKADIEQGMVFAISHMSCAIEIALIIILQIFQKIQDDYVKYFLLISDILFNTTTQDYRRLFARIIPFIIYQINKINASSASKQSEAKFKSELSSLINHWQFKFIFDEHYTRGLSFLLNFSDSRRGVNGIHDRLRYIGDIDDDEQSEFQLQKLCFENGIPFLETQKQESTRLINEYLWINTKSEQKVPQINEVYDGEPLSEKDLIKIKNRQIKTVTCEGIGIGILLDKNLQGKNKNNTSVSVDND